MPLLGLVGEAHELPNQGFIDPVTNKTFSNLLGKVLKRPAFFRRRSSR